MPQGVTVEVGFINPPKVGIRTNPLLSIKRILLFDSQFYWLQTTYRVAYNLAFRYIGNIRKGLHYQKDSKPTLAGGTLKRSVSPLCLFYADISHWMPLYLGSWFNSTTPPDQVPAPLDRGFSFLAP